MKRSNHDRLLRDVLSDEQVERLRAASLDQMLEVTRRRRRRNTWVSGAAASLAIVMTLLVLSHREASAPGAEQPPEPVTVRSRVKIIDDDQLLALFSDRSVALIGSPGKQRLVFLDGGVRRPAHEGRP